MTGRDEDDQTFNGSQAETASTQGLAHETPILVIAYNDDTADGFVEYTQSTRTVHPGASLLGWSWSGDGGTTWNYGGKIRPPTDQGIAALWGDPAIVTSRYSPNLVFISALAADSQIVPQGGRTGDMATSGACIARSTNGGINFSIFQCFSANRHFYDGAALAAAGSPGDQRIFAAYFDMATSHMDVWQSDDGLNPFHKLGDPFPNMTMIGHPRMAFDNASGALIIAAIGFNPGGNDYRIYMNRLVGGQWQAPKLVSQPITGVAIHVGTQWVRTASAFSFDVGNPSKRRGVATSGFVAEPDGIRLLYTTRDSATQRIYVRGSSCARDLSSCADEPQWGTTPGNFSNTPGQQWNPTVRASPTVGNAQAVWKATYQSTDDQSDMVSIKEGTLTRSPSGFAEFQPLPLMTPRIPCADLRTPAGYWGDYDESTNAGIDSAGAPYFLLAFSDSSKGCQARRAYSSTHLHVRAVKFK